MEEQFWQTRWKEGRTGFHDALPNTFLVARIEHLNLGPDAHIFVPLCGKTVDLDWLLARGYLVTGIEFNEGAARTVFERLNLVPEESQHRGLICLKSDRLTLWVGDFFELGIDDLVSVDAIYDRAALVALPDQTRADYTRHLIELTSAAPQLLISYTYDQALMEGPPFAVPEGTIHTLYHTTYEITLLDRSEISGPLSDRTKGSEEIWFLGPKVLLR